MPPLGKEKQKVKGFKDRIFKRKWKSLKERGIMPPTSEAEAKVKLKAAHGY